MVKTICIDLSHLEPAPLELRIIHIRPNNHGYTVCMYLHFLQVHAPSSFSSSASSMAFFNSLMAATNFWTSPVILITSLRSNGSSTRGIEVKFPPEAVEDRE